MEATVGRSAGSEGWWGAAARLAGEVAGGGWLPELTSPVVLEAGEVLHASAEVDGWRYLAIDVVFPRRRCVAVGGPLLAGVTAAATAVANRRARAEAERLAAPQWRHLGRLPVLATSHRLLVLHDGEWSSVWYEAICQLRPALHEDRLELFFDSDPPYLLGGPAVPYLAVVLTTALSALVGVDAVVSALLPA